MSAETTLQAVCDYCATISGLDPSLVLIEDSDAVRAGQAYLAVRVDDDASIIPPIAVQGDDSGTWSEQVQEWTERSVSVHGFGLATRAMLESIRRAYVGTIGAAKTLRDAGVSVVRAGQIVNVSALRQNATEPRFVLTLTVYDFDASTPAPVDTVSEIVVGLTLKRGEPPVTIATINVTEPTP